MITLERDKCNGCGLCARICHEHCMSLVDHAVSIDYQFCSTCTQCVAVCPKQALGWNHVHPVAYDRSRLPAPEQLDELFKERLSVRFFKSKRVDRPLLEEIVGYGIYAPTNNFELSAIVVDDEEIIEELDRIIQHWNSRIYNTLYKPRIVFGLLRRFWPKRDYIRARPKLEAALLRGYAIHRAAAMIFAVGDKRTPLSVDSAQYALYNMMLYAQLKGIGSCPWGPARLYLTKNSAARERLGLGKFEDIFAAVLLGYPAVKFRSKVEGKSMPMQWNGG